MNELFASLGDWIADRWQFLVTALQGPAFYTQIIVIIVAYLVSILLASLIKSRVRVFRDEPTAGALLPIRSALYRSRTLIHPALAFITLGVAVELVSIEDAITFVESPWLIRALRGLAAINFLFALITHIDG